MTAEPQIGCAVVMLLSLRQEQTQRFPITAVQMLDAVLFGNTYTAVCLKSESASGIKS